MFDQSPGATSWTWLRSISVALQWPVVVAAAFSMGHYIKALEARATRAEASLTALVERHMPAIHRSLAEIRGLLMSRR